MSLARGYPRMPKDIDEDLIEATIRRVQAQADAEPENTNPDDDSSPEEDAIEATIRRVQQQAAQAHAAPPEVEEPAVADFSPASAEVAAESESSTDDDDAIAATIRRVQQQVARSREAANGSGTRGGRLRRAGCPGRTRRTWYQRRLYLRDDSPRAGTGRCTHPQRIFRLRAHAIARP